MASKTPVENSKLVKQLAANDRFTRDAAVETLRKYLSGKDSVEYVELLKLWKGLFYCMWMSDRPQVQQNLANELSQLSTRVKRKNFVSFVQAFWETMCREWQGIDRLRLNKYYLLMRRYVEVGFEVLYSADWDPELVDSYCDMLSAVPLSPSNQKYPNGIRFHIIDTYLDSLAKLGPLQNIQDEESDKRQDTDFSRIPWVKLFSPFTLLSKESPAAFVRKRAGELMEDERLKAWVNDQTLDELLPAKKSNKRRRTDNSQERPSSRDSSPEWQGISNGDVEHSSDDATQSPDDETSEWGGIQDDELDAEVESDRGTSDSGKQGSAIPPVISKTRSGKKSRNDDSSRRKPLSLKRPKRPKVPKERKSSSSKR